jgi:hypothetical protein
MSRSRTPFLSGTILNNPLAIGGTSLSSAGLASLPAIASPNIAVLVLDPAGSGGVPEVVWVTAHTASATTATITRGAEGTTARAHNLNVPWIHAPTTYDFQETYGAQLTAASNLVLPVSDHEKFFVVNGTTTLNTMDPRPVGSRVYLQFTSDVIITCNAGTNGFVWPFVNAVSNNIIAKSDEILEFVFTAGNKWYLMARSQPSASGWQLMTRQNSTEQSANNNAASDMVTLGGLAIPVEKWVKITGQYRKASGTENVVIGLKINSTIIADSMFAIAGTPTGPGMFEIIIPPRDSSYPYSIMGRSEWHKSDASVGNSASMGTLLAAVPTAIITTIVIRSGNIGTGAGVVAVKNVIVEVL